jgi:hypothetical protein
MITSRLIAQWMLPLSAFAATLFVPSGAYAQCANSNTLVAQVGLPNIACPGSVGPFAMSRNRYVEVSVTTGNYYTFSVCGASWNTVITLYNGVAVTNTAFNDDGCTAGVGQGSFLGWTATFTGTLRVLLDLSTNCTSNSGPTAQMTITCGTPPSAPANDEPCGATSLTVNSSCAYSDHTLLGSTLTTGPPAPSCGGGVVGGDVWFSAVVPASGTLNVEADLGSSDPSVTDAVLQAYTAASCSGPFTLLQCDNDNGPGDMPNVQSTGLTPGNTIYYRLWSRSLGAQGNFRICAWTPPTVANDDPCGAVALTVNATCSTTAATTAGATGSAGPSAPFCGNYAGSDVWFSAVMPANGVLYIETQAGSLTDGAMQAYTAPSCAGPFTPVICSDNGTSMPALYLTADGITFSVGQTIYLRFWEYGGNNNGTFTICAFSPAQPANDNPCGATPFTVGTTNCNTTTTAIQNPFGASNTASVAVPCCGLYFTGADVWYTVTVPASGMLNIEFGSVGADGTSDVDFALYSAPSCSGPFTLLFCEDRKNTTLEAQLPQGVLNGLTPGEVLYLRVWGIVAFPGQFRMCIWSPALPASTCPTALVMTDNNRSGWGSSDVSASINGGSPTVYTVPNNRFLNVVFLSTNDLDILSLEYDNSGPNQNQNGYRLYRMSDWSGLFVAGPPPASGTTYAAQLQCSAPVLAAPEDCTGAITVCNSQPFNSNTTHTGFQEDMYCNNGCLGFGEQRTQWFAFSPTASGTIGLTIQPSVATNDYDFAVWGPMSSLTCPPPTAPLRCSWATLNGNTGMVASSVDLSEDANAPPINDGFVADIDVLAGEVYLLVVSKFTQTGLSFTLNWQLSTPGMLDCTVLPVDLLTFDAFPATSHVDLRWLTANEENSKTFIVERSADGRNFFALGSLPAAGYSQTSTSYTLRDVTPLRGTSFYRLVQVDLDGRMEYYHIVPVHFGGVMTSEVSLRPNPAQSAVEVALVVDRPGQVQITVLDAAGREVRKLYPFLESGPQRTSLPLDGLAAGSYSVQVLQDGTAVGRCARLVVE